jgi:hypothetical protein
MKLHNISKEQYKIRKSYANQLNTEIYFNWDFNEPIDEITLFDDDNNNITDTITVIIFGYSFNQSLDTLIFPKNLRELVLGYNYSSKFDNLPSELKILRLFNLKYPLTNLPIGLKLLYIQQHYSYHDDVDTIIEKSKIPFGCEVVIKKR